MRENGAKLQALLDVGRERGITLRPSRVPIDFSEAVCVTNFFTQTG
jgi:hypothetical protein